MSKNKPTPGARAKKNDAASLVRSSAAEYLTFVESSVVKQYLITVADGKAYQAKHYDCTQALAFKLAGHLVKGDLATS